MERGAGAWLRVLDEVGIIASATYENGALDEKRVGFICVPQAAFIDLRSKWESFSAVEFDSQVCLLRYQGKAVSFDDLSNPSFARGADGVTRRDLMRGLFFPPETPERGEVAPARAAVSHIVELSAKHLEALFGLCPLTSAELKSWNGQVSEGVSLLPAALTSEETASASSSGADPLKSRALVMNATQRAWLVEKGAVPASSFEALPDAGEGAKEEEEEEDSGSEDEVYALPSKRESREASAASKRMTKTKKKKAKEDGGRAWSLTKQLLMPLLAAAVAYYYATFGAKLPFPIRIGSHTYGMEEQREQMKEMQRRRAEFEKKAEWDSQLRDDLLGGARSARGNNAQQSQK